MVAFQLTKQARWLPPSIVLFLVAGMLMPITFKRDSSWGGAVLLVGLAALLTLHYIDVRELLRGQIKNQ